MLVLEAVTKRYGAVQALTELSLAVGEGELIALLGPSGSGKSTALRVIAGLEQADAGRVLIGGRDVTDVAPAKRDVAMVFQSFALFAHLTVRENIGFGLAARRTPAAEREQRVRAAAEALDLGQLLGRRPRALSGGERQRVALARALAGRPAVLLMDEPLSNLDAPLRERARAEIRRVHRETGMTVVYVTHDQGEALSLGERVALLDGGRLRQVGAPDEVYEHPADRVVARFVGSPPMNLVAARGAGGVLRGADGIVLPLPAGVVVAEGEEVLAGFRPEGAVCPVAVGGGDERVGFEAVLDVVERAGHERLWQLLAGAQRLAVRPPREATAVPGDVVGLAVDPSAVRLFDVGTGRAR
ncbi:MAG TPA: ABC transporter ATP-binding protein [Solirubrobacteraceae bacterium]|nr:ABC transporter ATP-binding protein [Solirubrobacteraceae bacterium]